MRGIRNPAPSRLSHRELGRADVCIVGAGAAGCVLAARLSEAATGRSAWSRPDPTTATTTPAAGRPTCSTPPTAPPRTTGATASTCACRVVGGCSAHNGCLVVWGTPADYDEWAAATGDEAWGWTGMAPLLARAEVAIAHAPVRRRTRSAPSRARALAGWAALGEPVLDDFNADDRDARRRPGAGQPPRPRRAGARRSPTSIRPAARPNLTIVADALADRVVVDGRPRARRRRPDAGRRRPDRGRHDRARRRRLRLARDPAAQRHRAGRRAARARHRRSSPTSPASAANLRRPPGRARAADGVGRARRRSWPPTTRAASSPTCSRS